MRSIKPKISCFYNCGVAGLTLETIEEHYQQYHTKFKPYAQEAFTCDNCFNYFPNSLLYSPARNRAELASKPHYCIQCANQAQKSPLKPKTMKKKKLKPKKAQKPLKSAKKRKILPKKPFPASALTLKSPCPSHTADYYHCLVQQTSPGLKGKKITQACSECKSLAPALNAQRAKEVKKLVQAYQQLGASLSKLI